jgi:dihydrofolate synthase/folylpolyglutamate synthase
MSLSLGEWLARIEAGHPRGSDGIELGLERVTRVKAALGQRETCPVILVAGTNGKGSTCAMLERIFVNAGYRVGLYTSPHLLRYNERIRINLQSVDDAALCSAFAKVEAARGAVPLTYFEFGTLAAWEVFAAASLDVIILEVGLGGRLDATNAYQPSVSVVTTVDLDHMEFLGPDREAIGREKAGIFRADTPAVCGDLDPPQSVRDYAAALDTPLYLRGHDFGYQRMDHQWLFWSRSLSETSDEAHPGTLVRRGGLAHPGLRGGNQLANAATVLQVVELLRDILPVAMKDIRQGLLEVELAGRFQVLPGRPTIVLDVAHNPQAARVLSENLGNTGFHPRTWAVFGMLADKDIDQVIAALQDRVTDWLPCTLEGGRAANSALLNDRLLAAGCQVSASFDQPAAALRYAQEHCGEDDRILAFGSFLTVAAVLTALGRTV